DSAIGWMASCIARPMMKLPAQKSGGGKSRRSPIGSNALGPVCFAGVVDDIFSGANESPPRAASRYPHQSQDCTPQRWGESTLLTQKPPRGRLRRFGKYLGCGGRI